MKGKRRNEEERYSKYRKGGYDIKRGGEEEKLGHMGKKKIEERSGRKDAKEKKMRVKERRRGGRKGRTLEKEERERGIEGRATGGGKERRGSEDLEKKKRRVESRGMERA